MDDVLLDGLNRPRMDRRHALAASLHLAGGALGVAAWSGAAEAQHAHGARPRSENLGLAFPSAVVAARVLIKLLGSVETQAVFSIFRLDLSWEGGAGARWPALNAVVRSDWTAGSEGHLARSRILILAPEGDGAPIDAVTRLFGKKRAIAGTSRIFVPSSLPAQFPAPSTKASQTGGIQSVDWQAIGDAAWASITLAPLAGLDQIRLDVSGDLALLAKHDLKMAPATLFMTASAMVSQGSSRRRLSIRGVGQKVLRPTDVPLSIERAVQSVDSTFFS